MKTRDVSMLIVEDDPTLLRGLKDAFSSAGYGIRVAIDGDSAVTMALEEAPDIMLLDLMLPGFDGFEVCEMVREDQPDLPILIVSARGKEEDIVRGLEAGADDFIIKPFSIAELRARVKAALRRTRGLGPGIFRFGEFQLDPGSRTLTHDGKEVGLTEQEYEVLVCFIGRAGRVLTRDQLLRSAWKRPPVGRTRTVDRCVAKLRSKIEPDVRRARFLKTIRGVGYRFDPD